jgi:hypothetical protein
MKFKVLKGTKLFDELNKVQEELAAAHRASKVIVKELGFKEWHKQSFCLGGGISAFRSKTKPDGYAFAYADRDREAIFPKKTKANKEILERIKNLPIIDYDRLNKLIKFDWRKSMKGNGKGGLHTSFAPGIAWRKEAVVLDIDEAYDDTYKPIKDMIEITTSEFKKLWNAKK